MLTGNQEKQDRELLKDWEDFEGEKYHLTTFFSENMDKTFVVENLLAARDRISRLEERASIKGYIENDWWSEEEIREVRGEPHVSYDDMKRKTEQLLEFLNNQSK